MAMGHVASSAPGASQMYVSVPIGSCGSWHPVVTLKPLWESPGTELSTWSIGSFCCIRAIQRTRLASRPLRSYTAIQRVLYSAIQYTAIQRYTLPYCIQPRCNTSLLSKEVHHSHHMLLVTSITSSNDERGIGGRSCLRPLVRLLEVVRGGELSQPSGSAQPCTAQAVLSLAFFEKKMKNI